VNHSIEKLFPGTTGQKSFRFFLKIRKIRIKRKKDRDKYVRTHYLSSSGLKNLREMVYLE